MTSMMMTNHDKAIAILRRTNDGCRLSPAHLSLLQRVLNRHGNEAAEAAFDELYVKVAAGEYDPESEYLFGIEHLTHGQYGHVYWRGAEVEHFSHSNPVEMLRDAESLAEKCRALEAKGFPVSSRALDSVVMSAPADTPWLEALLRFYTFFTNGTQVVAVFHRYGTPHAVVVEKQADGNLTREYFDTAYDAYHAFDSRDGFKSAGPFREYDDVRSLLEQSQLTPEDIRDAIA